MKYISTTKVSGGKLLRVKAEVETLVGGSVVASGENEPHAGVLHTVSLTGDFFMHPEDGVVELEKCLTGLSAGAEVREYVSRLNDVVAAHGFELIGFSASDIAQTLWNALHDTAHGVDGADKATGRA